MTLKVLEAFVGAFLSEAASMLGTKRALTLNYSSLKQWELFLEQRVEETWEWERDWK